MSDKKLYLVSVTGELYVTGEALNDVRECIRHASLSCTGSTIKFLDIERIKEVEMQEGHDHPQGQVRPS